MASYDKEHKVQRVHERLDRYEKLHQRFDERITRNERWRLQAQGALKFAALVLGGGAIALFIDIVISVF